MSKDETLHSDNDRVRNIAQGMGSLTIQNLATSALAFLFLAALLRLLPHVQFGIYSAVLVSAGVASTFASFGLNRAIVRFISSIRQKDEVASWVAVRKIFYVGLIFALVATAIYSLATPYLSIYFTKTESWTGVFLLSGLYLFLAIQTVFVVLFQAIARTMYILIIGLATVATDVSVSILLVPRLGLLGAATAKISVGLVGAGLGFYLARNYLQNLDRAKFYLKGLVAAAVPFLPTFALSHYVSMRTITLVPYAIEYSLVFIACLKVFNLLSDEDKVFISHVLPGFMQRLIRLI